VYCLFIGANQIETADGKIIKLEKLSSQERIAKAKLLLSSPGTKVYRHLVDGDVLLVNRQPTLHKPGIMAHKARILKHVREQTLRINYANCNAYNADFDGDEINCHFVQNELARAEANFICNTDNQYIVPTSGNPLRGLIQDHVAAAVKLTCKDTFLTREQFQQILYVGVCGLPGTEVVGPSDVLVMPPPTIYKPRALWTGKQVFSALLYHICRHPLPSLNLDGKTRTPPTAFGVDEMEHVVIIRYGSLLTGIMDKAAIGNASLGLVHAVYELYGPDHAGRLLSALGRMLTYYLQDAGHSCGIEDLTLSAKADRDRNRLLGKVNQDAAFGLESFLTSEQQAGLSSSASASSMTSAQIHHRIRAMLSTTTSQRQANKSKLDNAMQSSINKSASLVIKACLPSGLERSFLKNSFTLMVSTGAKGSGVNQSQITCFLGQQALEGQRVPMMASGKTLPSFSAYDTSPRAGGFVRDRFLTGVKPQEYYFHTMAGREGLVDTAVKTSRSGYLQRCLMKHLEDLKIAYDMTVRDSGGNVVQFLYGDDGIDPMMSATLHGQAQQMSFLARNNQALVHRFNIHDDYFNRDIHVDAAIDYHRQQEKLVSLAHQWQVAGSSERALVSLLSAGNMIYARKRINPMLPWSPKNLMKKWFLAEIIKVRDRELGVYDIRYLNDDKVEKKMSISIKLSAASGQSYSDVIHGHKQSKAAVYPLLTVQRPDPIMSALNIGSNIGCVSEKIQASIQSYSQKNPDQILTPTTSSTTITADSFELLVWMKYAHSLACPGEAVGCVAAQSIGEPSTQMTLNTFHLAGHGGANVTLGIPRLREIIMTASKALKTPTMLVPLEPAAADSAKLLGRKLGRLPLSMLLHHSQGITVGEKIERGVTSGIWERGYRVELRFEAPVVIQQAFDLPFAQVVQAVKTAFMAKLSYVIKQEQRRVGDRTAGKNDALNQFKSMGGGELDQEMEGGGRGRRRAAGEDGDADADGEASGEQKERETPKKSALDMLLDSDDEDDANKDNDSDDEAVIGRDRGVYDDEDDDSSEDEAPATDTDARADDSEDRQSPTGDDDSDNESVSPPRPPSSKEAASAAVTPVSEKKKPKAAAKKKSALGDDIFSIDEAAGIISFKLSFPSQTRRLLMVQMIEKSAAATTVRATKNISNAYAVAHELQSETKAVIQTMAVVTEGVNFEAIWSLPPELIRHHEIKSNDIWNILSTYGIEAARQSIVGEINGVFGVYGIDVNPRHLSLIADFMTRTGSYHAMNRIGMNENSSTLLQMSFETTCQFLLKAAQEGRHDNQESPSARIVMGSVPKIGTGCFDIMIPLATK
jgi:DNA-directed RNA polymerase I subunit RPA1